MNENATNWKQRFTPSDYRWFDLFIYLFLKNVLRGKKYIVSSKLFLCSAKKAFPSLHNYSVRMRFHLNI